MINLLSSNVFFDESDFTKDSEKNFYYLKNTQIDKKFIVVSITLTIFSGK